jgi:hypothetical protein
VGNKRETRVVSLTFAPVMWRRIDKIAKDMDSTVESVVLAMLGLGYADVMAISERVADPKRGVPLAQARRQSELGLPPRVFGRKRRG